ncbi:MAG: hypothetical protein PHH47_13510 [Gallionella sp.]|nr:hypothetical protein [Gallionella sp.]MDD4947952.1 hypothetical protein [Gallionella sp.]
MKVNELIAVLSALDPTMRVVVDGFETGFDVVHAVQSITVKPRQADSSGAFAAWNNGEPAEYDGALVRCESGEPGESVVFFPRTSN